MTVTTPNLTSLIDSIGTGYRVLNSRLWVLLIPLAFDALLLLGTPPLYATPLLAELLRQTEAGIKSLPAEQQEAWAPLLSDLKIFSDSDIRGALTWLNWVPTYITDAAGRADGIILDSSRSFVLALLQVNIVALLLSGVFLAPLADGARQQATTLAGLSSGAGRMILGVLCYTALVLGASITLGLPFLVLLALLVSVGSALALGALVITLIVLQTVMFAISIYCGFAVEAMLIDQIGPLRALGRSFRLVQHNFWPAIGLIGILLLINRGMVVVWQQIDERLAGRLLAIVGTAYIGAGLTAARMVFYRERSRVSTPHTPPPAQR